MERRSANREALFANDLGSNFVIVPIVRVSQVLRVGGLVVNMVKRRHEVNLHAPDLAFEGAEVLPGMIGGVFRRYSPEVIELQSLPGRLS